MTPIVLLHDRSMAFRLPNTLARSCSCRSACQRDIQVFHTGEQPCFKEKQNKTSGQITGFVSQQRKESTGAGINTQWAVLLITNAEDSPNHHSHNKPAPRQLERMKNSQSSDDSSRTLAICRITEACQTTARLKFRRLIQLAISFSAIFFIGCSK